MLNEKILDIGAATFAVAICIFLLLFALLSILFDLGMLLGVFKIILKGYWYEGFLSLGFFSISVSSQFMLLILFEAIDLDD